MTMFSSLTPFAFNVVIVPSRRAEMMGVFHRACTIPIRRLEPSCNVNGEQVCCLEEGYSPSYVFDSPKPFTADDAMAYYR